MQRSICCSSKHSCEAILYDRKADNFWRDATDFEHEMAVTLLEQSMNNVEAKVRDIKLILGST